MATLFTLPVQSHSVAFAGSAALPAGLHEVSILTNTETFPANSSLDVLIEFSFNGGATWRTDGAATRMAPTIAIPHLAFGVSLGTPYPTHARITLTPHGTVTFGATASIV